jgi:hypothetical protein
VEIAMDGGKETVTLPGINDNLCCLLWHVRIFPFYDVISAHWVKEETDVFPHAPFYFTEKELVDTGAKFEKILHQEWKIKGVHGSVPKVMFKR